MENFKGFVPEFDKTQVLGSNAFILGSMAKPRSSSAICLLYYQPFAFTFSRCLNLTVDAPPILETFDVP